MAGFFLVLTWPADGGCRQPTHITTLTTLTLLPLPHLQSTAIFFHNLLSCCMEVGGGRGSGHRVEGLLKKQLLRPDLLPQKVVVRE